MVSATEYSDGAAIIAVMPSGIAGCDDARLQRHWKI